MSAENNIDSFNKIIQLIEEGTPLRKAVLGIMSSETFYKLIHDSEELTKRYARACEVRADKMFEEILEIADNKDNDIETLELDGVEIQKSNKEVIERTKIRIDARKWMIGKMQPKKYGDKLDVTSAGNEIKQAPPTITIIKPTDA